MKIAYTVLIVTDEQEDDAPPVSSVAAALRMAAHHVLSNGLPDPSNTERIPHADGAAVVHVSLSAVELGELA